MNDVIFLSHGGGPLPILDKEGHSSMIEYYQSYGKHKQPKAIVVISAHNEADPIEVIIDHNEELYFDYYGFPPESYQYQYNPPINKEIGLQVVDLLQKQGFDVNQSNKGFDHGVFIPLMIMYPDASIPVIQVSLKTGLDPEEHIKMGEALSKLEDVLFIGSGSSYHNLRAYMSNNKEDNIKNDLFHKELIDIVSSNITESERRNKLINWNQLPYARSVHPREEHLIPLMVCYGIKQKQGKISYDDAIFGKRNICIEW